MASNSPWILYQSAFDSATVTGSAAATGYPVTNAYDRLHWTQHKRSTATAGAFELVADFGAGAAALSDAFATELDPLDASGSLWLDIGQQALHATGGVVTDSGETGLGGGERRHYVQSTDAFGGSGAGFVEAVITFRGATGAPAVEAGVSVRDSVLAEIITATITNSGVVNLSSASWSAAPATISGFAVDTAYTLRLEVNGRHAVVSVDGVAKHSREVTTGLSSTFSADQQGLYSPQGSGASNTAEWDTFSAGPVTRPTEPTAFAIVGHNFSESCTLGSVNFTVDVAYSDDDTIWTTVWGPAQIPATYDLANTVIAERWTATGATHRYWRVRLYSTATYLAAPSWGWVVLGTPLVLSEYLSIGFDPDAVSLRMREARSQGGNFMGNVVDHAAQKMSIVVGDAGFARADFDADEELGNWPHFLRTHWRHGRPFVVTRDVVLDAAMGRGGRWYGWPPSNAKISIPYSSQNRRDLKFSFDVLPEAYRD